MDAPQSDYVVGRVLPYLHETPASDTKAILDFTVSEAERLRLEGLPVLMEHNDGTTDQRTGHTRHLDEVGRVEAMSLHGVHARVLMSITPDASPAATYTRCAAGAPRSP